MMMMTTTTMMIMGMIMKHVYRGALLYGCSDSELGVGIEGRLNSLQNFAKQLGHWTQFYGEEASTDRGYMAFSSGLSFATWEEMVVLLQKVLRADELRARHKRMEDAEQTELETMHD